MHFEDISMLKKESDIDQLFIILVYLARFSDP